YAINTHGKHASSPNPRSPVRVVITSGRSRTPCDASAAPRRPSRSDAVLLEDGLDVTEVVVAPGRRCLPGGRTGAAQGGRRGAGRHRVGALRGPGGGLALLAGTATAALHCPCG